MTVRLGRTLSPGRVATRSVLYATLVGTSILMLIPFFWMVSTSLKYEADVFVWPPEWIPRRATLEHYREVFTILPFGRFALNSVIVAGAVALSNVIFDTAAAYAFARLKFPGRDKIFFLLLLTLMVPYQVNLIPLYRIMSFFGWIDTYLGLILPGATGVFGIFLMRQYILSIPEEILDSARIDGCSEFGVFWRIVFPLSLPGIATLTIFTFLSTWNDFLWPLLVTNSTEMRTLPVGLTELQTKNTTNWTQNMAGATISAIPMILVFLAMQRKFIEGLTAGAVKG